MNQDRDRRIKSQGSGGSESMTARTSNWDAQTLSAAGSATSPGRPRRWQGQTIDEYRRAKADRAIARIEECYQRGLGIPDVR